MTITDRLSASFLGVIALILIGFSTAIYLVASITLNRSIDDRLQAALGTLADLAEDEPGGFDWEHGDRSLSLGREAGHDQVRWIILDEKGMEVDRSKNLGDSTILNQPGSRRSDARGEPWRVAQRLIRSNHPESPIPGEDSTRPKRLVLATGLPLEPIDRPLTGLAITLPSLSILIWGLTALLGRRLCRTALAPLNRMAADARHLGANDPSQRLPMIETGDELSELALAFNGLLDRWQEALQRQSSFAGDASHQLRTPLTALIGQVDVALRRERPPEEYRQTLARVRDQSDRLRRIVESLLYLARADADAGLPTLELFDLSAWAAEQVRRRLRERLEAAPGPSLTVEGPILVQAHSSLCTEILENLLDNARDHGRGFRPVEVRVDRENGHARLIVEDHGRGLSSVELSRVFDPFYRTSDARRASPGGIGLGLAVARRIAVSLGGQLRAESQPGVGSRFILTLPFPSLEVTQFRKGRE